MDELVGALLVTVSLGWLVIWGAWALVTDYRAAHPRGVSRNRPVRGTKENR